jgi:hypothetical protein
MVYGLIVGGAFVAAVAVAVGYALHQRRVDPMPPGASDRDIARIARDGDGLRAIRWYRTVHGGGIKEAKEAVERMAAGDGIVDDR